MPDADYVREFEQFLEEMIRREINYISWVSLTYGRLKREVATMASTFPDSTKLTDFACEECDKPLVHHFKGGGEGYDFFGCSGCLDGCMTLYDNRDGRPVRKA
jgi:ssDNA-binding Zn-finger/Zn-ribbon topoisomerase 1